MSTRKLLLALAFAGAAPLSAMAGADFVNVGGELGYTLQQVPTTGMTRPEKIAQDRAQAAAEAAQLSGWRRVKGELGWTYEGHKFARVNGEFGCVDGIDHSVQAGLVPAADPALYRGV